MNTAGGHGRADGCDYLLLFSFSYSFPQGICRFYSARKRRKLFWEFRVSLVILLSAIISLLYLLALVLLVCHIRVGCLQSDDYISGKSLINIQTTSVYNVFSLHSS